MAEQSFLPRLFFAPSLCSHTSLSISNEIKLHFPPPYIPFHAQPGLDRQSFLERWFLVLGPILEVAFTFGCHFDLRAPPTAFPVGPLAANDLRTLLFTTLVFAIELGVTVGVIVIDLLTRATTLSSRPVAADSLFAFCFAARVVGTRLDNAP